MGFFSSLVSSPIFWAGVGVATGGIAFAGMGAGMAAAIPGGQLGLMAAGGALGAMKGPGLLPGGMPMPSMPIAATLSPPAMRITQEITKGKASLRARTKKARSRKLSQVVIPGYLAPVSTYRPALYDVLG